MALFLRILNLAICFGGTLMIFFLLFEKSSFIARFVAILLLASSNYFQLLYFQETSGVLLYILLVILPILFAVASLAAIYKLLFRIGKEETGRYTVSENMFQKTEQVSYREKSKDEVLEEGYSIAAFVLFLQGIISIVQFVRA